ncbi:hypothetical protein SUGI_0379880 [Cryptomeria japonica]|nr:hypothetical protein SUGI_0379880 [Cryptomeria japonica]
MLRGDVFSWLHDVIIKIRAREIIHVRREKCRGGFNHSCLLIGFCHLLKHGPVIIYSTKQLTCTLQFKNCHSFWGPILTMVGSKSSRGELKEHKEQQTSYKTRLQIISVMP